MSRWLSGSKLQTVTSAHWPSRTSPPSHCHRWELLSGTVCTMSHPPPCRCANNPHLSVNQSINQSIDLSISHLSIYLACLSMPPASVIHSFTLMDWMTCMLNETLTQNHAHTAGPTGLWARYRPGWTRAGSPNSLCADGSGWAAIRTQLCVCHRNTKMKHAEYSCLLLYVAASEQTSAEFVIVFADLFASEADNLHVFDELH